MQKEINEQLNLLNQVYELLIDLAVNWSFKLFGAMVVLCAGFVIGRWIANWLSRLMENHDVDITLRQFIASALRLVVLAMFGIIALNQLGVSITPLIAAIGGLAVGLSLALQGPVSNYGAGLVIILTRMFKVGDTVTTQGCSGLVEDISLAQTQLRAEDGELIVIPNKHIVGEIHTNSRSNRIVEGRIGIAYDASPARAVSLIEAVLAANENVDHSVQSEVGISQFGESGIDIEYRYWTATGSYYNTVHAVNLAIFEAFGRNHIGIPFPQREIRVLND